MLAPGAAGDLLRTLSPHAQPGSDTLRSDQRHPARLAADVQAELARVTQQHAPEPRVPRTRWRTR